MRSLSRAAFVALFLGSLVPITTASNATASGGTQRVISWLAAGDSYASGAGLPHPNSPCAQGTGENGLSSTWAVVAAKKLSAEGWSIKGGGPTLVACTGAISDEFFNSHTGLVDELVGTPHGPQWTKKMGRYNLVTFSFGGDDLGFSSILQHCLSSGCAPDAAVRSKIHQLATTGVYKGSLHIPSYPVFLNHVANAAVTTGGNVVVMGYPEIFEDPSLWPAALKFAKVCQGFLPGQVALIRGLAGDLNATIGSVVARVNAEPYAQRNGVHFTFIDPVTGQARNGISLNDPNLFEPAQGTRHELCSNGDQAWLNGLSPAHLTTRSFHPDQPGNDAMARLVEQVVPSLSWSELATTPITNTVSVMVPTKICAATGAGSGSGYPVPHARILKLPRDLKYSMTAYVSGSGSTYTLAPSGWKCSAVVGGDGSTLLTVSSPSDASAKVSFYQTNCDYCEFDLTCPFLVPFPVALSYGEGPCQQSLPPYETVTKLSKTQATFKIPAGDGGRSNALGGLSSDPNPIQGIVVFTPPNEEYGSGIDSCGLPASQQSICPVIEQTFRAQFG